MSLLLFYLEIIYSTLSFFSCIRKQFLRFHVIEYSTRVNLKTYLIKLVGKKKKGKKG